MSKPVVYVYMSHAEDWECFVSEESIVLAADDDLYLAGTVSNLKELFLLMDAHDFDGEYFYNFVDHCLSHRLYNLLNADGGF